MVVRLETVFLKVAPFWYYLRDLSNGRGLSSIGCRMKHVLKRTRHTTYTEKEKTRMCLNLRDGYTIFRFVERKQILVSAQEPANCNTLDARFPHTSMINSA